MAAGVPEGSSVTPMRNASLVEEMQAAVGSQHIGSFNLALLYAQMKQFSRCVHTLESAFGVDTSVFTGPVLFAWGHAKLQVRVAVFQLVLPSVASASPAQEGEAQKKQLESSLKGPYASVGVAGDLLFTCACFTGAAEQARGVRNPGLDAVLSAVETCNKVARSHPLVQYLCVS